MAKLRVNSNTESFEWEGTPEELLLIYDGLKQRFGNVPHIENVPLHQHEPMPKKLSLPSDYAELSEKMPNVEQLVNYILSKPNFEHDIVDVGKKFFGKQIRARKYGRLYRELRNKLKVARKSIESSHRGAFERRSSPSRNLQIFTFKRLGAVQFATPLHKTS